MSWRFWCASCGRMSALQRPLFAYGLLFSSRVVLFIGMLGPMYMLLSYLSPAFPVLWAAGAGVALAIVASYLFDPLLTRIAHTYVPSTDGAL